MENELSEDKLVSLPETELFEHYKLVADLGQTMLRIDKFLFDRIPNVTRSKLQAGIRNGLVKVNEQLIKANYKVRPNDTITLSLPHPPRDKTMEGENIPLSITYEDDHLMVIHKPAGMVVHPTLGHWTGTLVNALIYHFNNLPGHEARPGIVHRIDKNTSGLMVIAKTHDAMVGLAQQFFDHTIERTYYALVWGDPEATQGSIDVNVGRSLKDRKVMTSFPRGDHGKKALTHYEVLKRFHYVSLVKCQLETGRTHQIRVHMRYLGHPLFNDTHYGGDAILKGPKFSKYRQFIQNCFNAMPRQGLHAKTVGFIHPITKEKLHFDSELPDDLSSVIEKWEHYLKYNESKISR